MAKTKKRKKRVNTAIATGGKAWRSRRYAVILAVAGIGGALGGWGLAHRQDLADGAMAQISPVSDAPAHVAALVEPRELYASLSRPDGPMLVDVRMEETYKLGHLPWATNVPYYGIYHHLDKVPLGVKLALYCS